MKHLEWECLKKHRWKAIPDSIKRGSWCPHCSKNVQLKLSDIQRLAEDRGGKCLSTIYINLHTEMEFKCSKGHAWFGIPNDIKYGTWCPTCAWDKRWETRRKNKYNKELH